MPQSSEVLGVASLTRAVNRMKVPSSFLKNTFFSRERSFPTRSVELSVLRRGRKVAPFVKRNGAGLMVDGHSEEFKNVMPAHIRIKRPINPGELMNKRRPEQDIFADAGSIQNAMREFQARELGNLMDPISEAEEWLSAMALRGVISYSAADEASFEVDFGREAAFDITLSGGDRWDQSGSTPQTTFQDVMDIMNESISLNPTDVVLGADAAAAFLENAEVKELYRGFNANVVLGVLNMQSQVQDNGAQLLGSFVNGVQVWRYARQTTLADGTVVDLIRPNYAEFIHRGAGARRVMYYGAIEDMDAIGEGRLLQSKRFSKSWIEKDPSARMLLVESNPLAVLEIPESCASVQVIDP